MTYGLKTVKRDGMDANQWSVDREDPALYNELTWGDCYVNFSGYFGNIGPEVFASAPELRDCLRDLYIWVAFLPVKHPQQSAQRERARQLLEHLEASK